MRALSWWVKWEDLECGNPGLHDRIERRADAFAAASADTAVIFGAHFRWDFLPYWDNLHAYIADVAEVLAERGIRLFDHHSATLIHRYGTVAEMKRLMFEMIHHLPLVPSREAAASWRFGGELLDSWRIVDAASEAPGKIGGYSAEQFCINHPGFAAAYRNYLARLLKETGVAGLMCDDLIYFGGFHTCACPHCRGLLDFELPPVDDASFWGNWGDARWRRYLAMRRDSVGRFIEGVRDVLPENFPLMSCCTSGAYGGNNYCAQSVHEFLRGDNILNLEICGDNPADVRERLASGSYHAGAGAQYGVPVVAIGYGFYPDSAGHLWALNSMTGFSTWFSTLKGRLGLPGEMLEKLPGDAEPIAAAFAFERAHPELFRERPEYECAVYFSETSKTDTFFGACETGATLDYRNLMRLFADAGIRAQTIFKFPFDATEVSCVVVPSAVLMTDAERDAMERYRREGGVLFVSGPDSTAGFPDAPEEFASLKWLQNQQFDYEPGEGAWREERPRLFRNPARLPERLPELIRSFSSDGFRIHAPGFAVSIRRTSIHFLALEYDVTLDDAAEKSRRQHSHVRLIRTATPRNCTSRIALDLPVRAAYCPLGGSAAIDADGVTLQGNPMYLILAICV